MFLRFYLIYGAAMCAWLTAAAIGGWQAVHLGSDGDGGLMFYGPGRGSGGYHSTWHGGK